MVKENQIYREVLRESNEGIGAELYLYQIPEKNQFYFLLIDSGLTKGKKSDYFKNEDFKVPGKILDILRGLLIYNDEFCRKIYEIEKAIQEIINSINKEKESIAPKESEEKEIGENLNKLLAGELPSRKEKIKKLIGVKKAENSMNELEKEYEEEKEEEPRQKEAKWISDKDTLEKGFFKFNRNIDGTYPYMTQEDCNIGNVSIKNADRWINEQNERIRKDNKIQLVKNKINSWADNYKENQIEIEAEIKEFAEQTEELYSISDLKKLINDEIKKRQNKIKEKEKEDKKKYVEEKKKKFEESNFLFSNFNQFTNYLKIAEDFHNKQPFYYDDHKIWWLWNNNKYKWERVDDIYLMNAIDENTQNPSTNLNIKYEIIESLKRIGRKHKPKEAEKTWIQFKENIYNLKTKEIFLAKPDYFITNPIPWSIGLSEKTPIIDKILKEWVYKEGIQDESYVLTLKEIMAYAMLSYMPIHRIFCLIGDGLNGKGTFLRLMENLIGEGNYCASEIERLSSDRFESNKLHKKLVCFVGEIDKGIFKKTKTIKSLTGEDTVRIEFKGKDGFDGKNYANPIITTNHLPETSDKTKGFYRRWTIVDFPNIFNEKKNILDEIPKEEYNNFCKQALEIITNLLERGEFTNDGTIQERENKYEKHSNYINEFFKLYCEKDEKGYIPFTDFCDKYNEYLVSEGMIKKSKVEIGRIVVLKGFIKKVRKISTDFRDSTQLCIESIKWKGEIEELI